MSSPSAVVCREVFDENSQPSAEEISDYAQQLGIDPESESHLLPLARDGLMQALPAPWKAYYDEKLDTHYYYNEDTKSTQWEHPLDNVYRELVKKARDASILEDTCASVQELPTYEEHTKNLERVETKVESEDDDLSTDSGENAPETKEKPTLVPGLKRLTPLGRPPIAPLTRFDKKLGDLRISPLRRSVDSPSSPKPLVRNMSDRDVLNRQAERPKNLFKQHSEIIDLKMHVLNSPVEETFTSLLSGAKVEKGLPLSGKGMFYRVSKSDLPSPDTDKSYPLDSMTKSDPPKGILREKLSDVLHKRVENLVSGKARQTCSFEEDKKSVRFKLESLPEPTISPGSNSSSEINDNQSSIISATPVPIPSPKIPSSPIIPLSPITPSPLVPLPIPNVTLAPLVGRPPLPPKMVDSPKSGSGPDKEAIDTDAHKPATSPRRRLLRPPAADYIKPDLFQKNFQKISDIVRPGEIETECVHLEEPQLTEKEVRPRSPMIPQKNKISINLMESIESETSIDSPDREFANLDLNDLNDSNDLPKDDNDVKKETTEDEKSIQVDSAKDNDDASSVHSKTNSSIKSPRTSNVTVPQIKVPKLDFLTKQSKLAHSDSDDSKQTDDVKTKSDISSKSEVVEIKDRTPQLKISPTVSLGSELRSPKPDLRPWSPLSTFKPNRAVIAPLKSSDSAASLGKSLASPRLDGVIISQGKSTDNVVVMYQFESQADSPKPIKSPIIPDMGARDFIERNKADERRRLELALQKELESIRVEWTAKERRMRAELYEELKEAEEKFLREKRMRLAEQVERNRREMEEASSSNETNHLQSLKEAAKEIQERFSRDSEAAAKKHEEDMNRIRDGYRKRLAEQQELLEIENERALTELTAQLQASLASARARMLEENRATIEAMREEHSARITELRQDYRAEVERLRTQHACHLEELRARLATERAASRHTDERAIADKYKCLKEKYVRLKHDVKMSIERRNKRREMSMTTGSETEKSNSHKANQSLERCKELNETSVSAVIEPEPRRNNLVLNDNETSQSEVNVNNNNNREPPLDTSQPSVRPRRRTAVAFREPPRRRHRDTDAGATTDCQDSSDATTADEKPKESVNGHGRRRCFTRLKSASTSRLNYSPKRGEGWSSPLESLRQQLRKLDDLEDQFPDLACQPAYSLRYPFAELGPVARADTPELEFVRHRALIEREGMRRARAVLKRRRAALKESRASLSPHRAPSEGTTSDGSSNTSDAGAAAAGGAVLRSLRALHADVRDIWRALDARRPHTASPETSSCNAPTTSQTRMTLSAPEPPIQQDYSDGSVAERARSLRAWLQTAP